MWLHFIVLSNLFVIAFGQQLLCDIHVNRLFKIENMDMICVELEITQDSLSDIVRRDFSFFDKRISVRYRIENERFLTYLSNTVCYELMDSLLTIKVLHLCGVVESVSRINDMEVFGTELIIKRRDQDLRSVCRLIQDRLDTTIAVRNVLLSNNCKTFYCKSLALGDGEDCLENKNTNISNIMTISPRAIMILPEVHAICLEMAITKKTRGITSVSLTSKEDMKYILYQDQIREIIPKGRICRDSSYKWDMQRNSEILCTFHSDDLNFDRGEIVLTGTYSIMYSTFSPHVKTARMALNETWDVGEIIRNLQQFPLVCPQECPQSCQPTCSTLIYGNGNVICNGRWRRISLEESLSLKTTRQPVGDFEQTRQGSLVDSVTELIDDRTETSTKPDGDTAEPEKTTLEHFEDRQTALSEGGMKNPMAGSTRDSGREIRISTHGLSGEIFATTTTNPTGKQSTQELPKQATAISQATILMSTPSIEDSTSPFTTPGIETEDEMDNERAVQYNENNTFNNTNEFLDNFVTGKITTPHDKTNKSHFVRTTAVTNVEGNHKGNRLWIYITSKASSSVALSFSLVFITANIHFDAYTCSDPC